MKNKIFFTLILCSSLYSSEILTFSKAYNMALKNSKEMKSIKYQEKAIKEQINQEKAALYPQINLSATVGKNDYELNHRQRRLDYDVNGNPLNLTVSVTQAVYDPEILNRINMQKTKENIFHTKASLQRQDLAQKALRVYSDILKSQNKIKFLKSNIRYYKSFFETIKSKYKLKLANKMDLLEREVDLNNAKIELKKEQSIQKIYKLQLSNYIGTNDFSFPDINLERLDYYIIDKMYKIATKNVKKIDSLMLKEAKLNFKLAQEETQSAYNEHKPKINLQASYTKYSKDDDSAYYENTKSVALKFNLPIYKGGYVQSKIISSKFKEKASQMDVENIKEQVRVEYSRNLAIFNAALDSINLFREALISANLYFESVKEGYENGLKDQMELYKAKTKIYDVKYKYMDSLYKLVDSYISLLILSNDFENLSILDGVLT